MSAVMPLKFQVGARTLAAIPRRLVRVGLSLDDVLIGHVPALPLLERAADGYLVTSLPAALAPAVGRDGLIRHVRQRYTRYHVDLAAGEAAWQAGLSSGARSMVKRKTKKLAQASGGIVEIAAASSADTLAALLPAMRAVAATTYQHRLLGSELPADAELLRRAAADEVRGWLLAIESRPAAYLLCTAAGDTLRYDHVGHDPAFGELSPGTVLMARALADLMAERRFARFDFTEGEGQHKRQLASGGTACVDLLLLRATLANRVAIATLAGFDAATAWGKARMRSPRWKGLVDRLRR